MSWVTIIWSMISASCLTLAAIHFLVWCQRRSAWSDLLLALTSGSVAVYAGFELSMMRAETPAQFITALLWVQIPVWGIVLSLVGFVRLHLRAGRPGLGWTIVALRSFALILNFLVGQNLNYREVTGLRHVPFLGEWVSIGVGVSNPCMLVGQFSLLLLWIFTMDAAITVWRRGERRQALVTGGGIVVFTLAGVVEAVLVLWQIVAWPLTASLFYLGFIVAMGYDRSRETLRAVQLARDLGENEKRMNLAAEAGNLGVWVRDFERNEIWASEKWRELLGLPKSGRLELDEILQRMHPEDRDHVRNVLAQASASDGGYEMEYRVMLPNEKMRWIGSRGRVEFDDARKPVRVRGVSIDITERKRSEEAVRESEARFRTVADTAPVMIWMSGTDKLCNFFNQGWLDFSGRTLEEELGNGWAEGVHPADLEGCLQTYTASFDARREFTMQYRLRRGDGQYSWVLDTGVPRLTEDGVFLGYIGSCIDITTQKQAEERFRLVVDAAPNAMVMVNSEGVIVLVNTQAETVFGYGRAELIGLTIEQLVPERFHARHPGHRHDYLSGPTTRAMGAGRELFGRRKDGSEVPVEIGLNPIRMPEGMFVLASIVDITARKQTEAEMVLLRQEIAHVDRVSMMGQLASALAHEINQPLGAILRNAEAAELFMQHESPDLDEIRAILADIRKDDQRANAVIDRMRTLMRRHELATQALDVAEFVGEVTALTRSDAALRGVTVETMLPSDLPQVGGDRVHLQQVLLNLIINGMDAVSESAVNDRLITVCARRDGGQTIEIAVSDSGSGIPADKLARIFDPFFTTKTNGMGMGLAISRTIIEAHGGRLWAENNLGRGATFRFNLKTAEAAATS